MLKQLAERPRIVRKKIELSSVNTVLYGTDGRYAVHMAFRADPDDGPQNRSWHVGPGCKLPHTDYCTVLHALPPQWSESVRQMLYAVGSMAVEEMRTRDIRFRMLTYT